MTSKVNFFATCMGQSALQDTTISSIKLLRHFGVDVVYKKNQTCCGQPAFNTGYFKEAKDVAFYNMALFADNDYPIVVGAGSCSGMLSHDYNELFKHDSEETKKAVAAFSSRVMDLSQYLESIGAKLEDKGDPIDVTFHTSCHSLRVQQCIPAQKNLIRQLSNVTLHDLDYEEECCGFGGTFAVKEPEISDAMVTEKIRNIKNTNCKIVIAGDNGCILNISGAMAKKGEDIAVMQIYDFLLKRITGESVL